jgi:hypothetical protein
MSREPLPAQAAWMSSSQNYLILLDSMSPKSISIAAFGAVGRHSQAIIAVDSRVSRVAALINGAVL